MSFDEYKLYAGTKHGIKSFESDEMSRENVNSSIENLENTSFETLIEHANKKTNTNRTKNKRSRNKPKSIVVKNYDVTVTKVMGSIIAGLIALGTITALYQENAKVENMPKSETNSIVAEAIELPEYKIDSPELEAQTVNWSGTNYEVLSEDQVVELARYALDYVETLLKDRVGDELTPMATKKGEFYPEYFNAYFLASQAFTESSYRVVASDGSTLTSSAGAMGLCQITPDTIDGINHWLHNVMEIKDITFTYEDANDPQKNMIMCVCVNIANCKNYFKEGKGIYEDLGVDFDLELQKKMLIFAYNNGTGATSRSADNGTLLDDIKNSNYVSKLLMKEAELNEKYDSMSR